MDTTEQPTVTNEQQAIDPVPEFKSTGCDYCDRELSRGNRFFPPHKASSSCRSGGHNHCSCDTCF